MMGSNQMGSPWGNMLGRIGASVPQMQPRLVAPIGPSVPPTPVQDMGNQMARPLPVNDQSTPTNDQFMDMKNMMAGMQPMNQPINGTTWNVEPMSMMRRPMMVPRTRGIFGF